MDDQEMVTLCTVQTPSEAEIIRGTMQAEGIACQIGGESQAALAGVLAIDVLVHAGDIKKARKILREARHARQERRKKQASAKKARADTEGASSEAIQELNPKTDIQKKKT